MKAKGRFEAPHVVIGDEAAANRLYNKGFFGTPLSGNGLQLHAVEAAYAIHQERLIVDAELLDILAGNEVAFIAYADLRSRGLVVRPEGDGFAVWARGEGPPQPHEYIAHFKGEREDVRGEALWEMAIHNQVLSIVDDDGVVTHYRVEAIEPSGTNAPVVGTYTGRIMADRVQADDGLAEWGYGTMQQVLWLNDLEAVYLQEKGHLSLPEEVRIRASKAPNFEAIYEVYADLRTKGTLPRSGYRFGTHLRAYRGTMDDHAPWLIDCLQQAQWSSISRGVRLAHGVRKQFLLALGDARYVSLAWLRP